MKELKSDTIFAPITAIGGSTAVIRVSGSGVRLVQKITNRQHSLSWSEPFTTLCTINDENGMFVDQVLMHFFKGPKSFTGEDVLEISCHGGRLVVQKILTLLEQDCNFRYAQPGEFSKRSFLNGKIDLVEAEGIDAIIKAETELQHSIAVSMLCGKTSQMYHDWRNGVIEIMAMIEANIDFSDEDIPNDIMQEMISRVENLTKEMRLYIDRINVGKAIQNGILVAIVGPPNAGKSSLINAITNKDIAIVTSIAGTTRDAIEAHCNIDGYKVTFVDTAGIRDTQDEIEKIGISKANQYINSSYINLILFDKDFTMAAKPLDLILINKIDTMSSQELSKVQELCSSRYPHNPILTVSALAKTNINTLLEQVSKILHSNLNPSNVLSSSERHESIIQKSIDLLDNLNFNSPIEVLAEDLRCIANVIGDINGVISNDEVLGVIFGKFCIGK